MEPGLELEQPVLDAARQCGTTVPPGCRGDLDESDCRAVGGTFIDQPHLFASPCFCPTPDSGCPCTDSTQCAGDCVDMQAESSACSAVRAGMCSPFFSTPSCVCVLGPVDQIPAGTARYRCNG